jgi:N-acetylglutamate synthase-like GNAT family acetyltransferase
MSDFVIRPIKETDRSQIRAILTERWGSSIIVSRGIIHEADKLPGFIAEENGRLVGLVTYEIKSKGCEIITLNSFRENMGIASALIEKVKNIAGDAGCGRLWLITTMIT